MSDAEGPSAAEIEQAIKACKEKIAKIQNIINERAGSNQAITLEPALRSTRGDLATMERQLDLAKQQEQKSAANVAQLQVDIKEHERRIADLEQQMKSAHDGVDINNLEVSRRFLQMERNQLLCELTELESAKNVENANDGTDAEDSDTELRRSNDAKTRIIEDLNQKLEKTQKELAVAKAMIDGYEGDADPDTTRVTVKAERIQGLKNENRRLQAENEGLRAHDAMTSHSTVGLTAHCKDMEEHARNLESQLLETTERCNALAGNTEALEKEIRRLQAENDGLKAHLDDLESQSNRKS